MRVPKLVKDVSNGCSAGVSEVWRFVTGRKAPFLSCCDYHDVEYVLARPRRRADRRFRECIIRNGVWPPAAWGAYIMLRLFGWVWYHWPKTDDDIDDAVERDALHRELERRRRERVEPE
jgi:hypothetical protein